MLLTAAERATAGLRAVVATLVVGFYVYMVLAVLAQVGGRYLFNYSIAGAAETATFAQIWMALLGAGVAMRRELHVGVDLVAAHLPLAAWRLLQLATTAAALWFLWVVFDGSFQLLKIGRIQTSSALQIPMWLPYLSLPIGSAYFAFELCLAFARRWHGPLGPAGAAADS